jgi:hypothetical protein
MQANAPHDRRQLICFNFTFGSAKEGIAGTVLYLPLNMQGSCISAAEYPCPVGRMVQIAALVGRPTEDLECISAASRPVHVHKRTKNWRLAFKLNGIRIDAALRVMQYYHSQAHK